VLNANGSLWDNFLVSLLGVRFRVSVVASRPGPSRFNPNRYHLGFVYFQTCPALQMLFWLKYWMVSKYEHMAKTSKLRSMRSKIKSEGARDTSSFFAFKIPKSELRFLIWRFVVRRCLSWKRQNQAGTPHVEREVVCKSATA
jgi:hypothetical protein